LQALPGGALWWPDQRLLAVGDLHLGRAERMVRDGGALLPPYETRDTLDRLEAVIAETRPQILVLLGDSFDSMHAAADLEAAVLRRLVRMAAGRRPIWIAGNHDPGPADLPGTNMAELSVGGLQFRHIAKPERTSEVAAHYHPKARFWLRGTLISRPCFLADARRVILPAFGTFTGGLDIRDAAFDGLVDGDATAMLTGRRITALRRDALLARCPSL